MEYLSSFSLQDEVKDWLFLCVTWPQLNDQSVSPSVVLPAELVNNINVPNSYKLPKKFKAIIS